MKIDDMRKDRAVTIEDILPGCVFALEDELFMATNTTDDGETRRVCVCIEDGRMAKFMLSTTVVLVDAKAVIS